MILLGAAAVLSAIKPKSHIRQLINGGCRAAAGGHGHTTLVFVKLKYETYLILPLLVFAVVVFTPILTDSKLLLHLCLDE